MLEKKVTIVNEKGLHARPATNFIQAANNYRSSLWVEIADRRANAKSLLGILSLGVSKGDEVTLIADGTDEEEALAGLADVITRMED